MNYIPVNNDLIEDFNKVLCGSQQGERVFTRILMDLGLFRPLEGPDDVTRHNYAVQLLIYAGICSPDRRSQVIRNILSLRTKRTLKRMLKHRVPVEGVMNE